MIARFNGPDGVAVMQNGSVVVSDNYNYRIRLVAPDGTVTTLAGNGTAGFADGPAMTAQFNYPYGVAVVQNGSVVVADFYNNRIRLLFRGADGNYAVTTVAGNGTAGLTDGPAMTARFYHPSGVAAMQNGSVVVADSYNNRIRLIDDIASTLCTVAANCNNHATSVSGTLSSGCTCTCSTGYGGAACSSCATRYNGYPACSPIACTISADCNGHASSVSGTLVNGCTCSCSTGYGGAACSSCATHYSGYPACSPTACANSDDCNGHASTVSGTLVSGCTCTCSTGYVGATCSSCSTYYTGYPVCTLTFCGTNVTLTSQPPAIELLSVSLSHDNADVTMVLSAKGRNSVVVVYQRDVDQTVPSRQLAGISRNDFSLYATCATAPTGIIVAADGTGTVTYSHFVDYTLCEQGATDRYVVITCAFAVEHYVWPAAEQVPLMTVSMAPITIRVPRTLEQAIGGERFTFQIFPGLLVATARSANRIRSFTLVQSSSWIAGSSMCTLSTDALSFSCLLHPMAAEGQHNAQFQVVFANDEASSVGVPVSVRTHYVGKHAPNIFGRSVAIHFTTTDLKYGPSEALVFLYQKQTAVYGNSTYLSALLLINAAGESISVMNNSAAFNFMCSNVPATDLTECSFLPAAVSTINRHFDAVSANLTLRASFSFDAPSSRRDTEDLILTTGLTIDHSTPTSRTTMIVVVVVVCSVVLLLILGVAAYVVSKRSGREL